ncbi:MAG TPA: tRNA (pseudouridine(54)-N(1))-methyltransferase TrmY [archaeon]|nr:tRNA (pseudouridine(54)-N(1))-methyltransferase TrmY [archaeon]HLD81051.1 tRNA (pseudouridine(54)-N(1))-methyltransferase TrmY [archaeon]
MRTFVLLSNNARTDGNWSLNDLPGAGRMDLIARCINSAFWLSDTLRKDVELYVVLGGPPRPPVCVKFKSSELRQMSPDERNIASSVKELLGKQLSSDWASNGRGGYACLKGFEELLSGIETEKGTENIYWLTAGGAHFKEYDGKGFANAAFVLGDAVGPSKEQKKLLRKYNKLSLGATEYLASHCIAVINWLADTA